MPGARRSYPFLSCFAVFCKIVYPWRVRKSGQLQWVALERLRYTRYQAVDIDPQCLVMADRYWQGIMKEIEI